MSTAFMVRMVLPARSKRRPAGLGAQHPDLQDGTDVRKPEHREPPKPQDVQHESRHHHHKPGRLHNRTFGPEFNKDGDHHRGHPGPGQEIVKTPDTGISAVDSMIDVPMYHGGKS